MTWQQSRQISGWVAVGAGVLALLLIVAGWFWPTGFAVDETALVNLNGVGEISVPTFTSQGEVFYLSARQESVMLTLLSVSLLSGLVFAGGWFVRRWRTRANSVLLEGSSAPNQPTDTLIAYASQTGSAQSLAQRLHKSIAQQADLFCVSALNAALLDQYRRVIFVVSTHGNGEAPDKARAFEKALQSWQAPSGESSSQQQTVALHNDKQVSILALGDRSYQTFCAFGHRLCQEFSRLGWQPLTDTPVVEVDRMHMPTVQDWWGKVTTAIQGKAEVVDSGYRPFTLLQNRCLNRDKPQRRAHALRLHRAGCEYQVGDVIAIRAKILGEWLPERLYSIASCERDIIDLLVREHWRDDGTPGDCSHYLTHLTVGSQISAEVRTHAHFHLKEDVPLILIGAGTGIAPLLGFLRQKAAWRSRTPNWLLFGEQSAKSDHYYQAELAQLQASGTLTKLDCAWSRDEGLYVQDKLLLQQETLQYWVENLGAHIYLCGSRQGFGESVMAELATWLRPELIEARLHMDLY